MLAAVGGTAAVFPCTDSDGRPLKKGEHRLSAAFLFAAVVGHVIPREFLRVFRADPTGFVHRFCGCLRSSWSWAGSGDPNGSNRPQADIDARGRERQDSAKRLAL